MSSVLPFDIIALIIDIVGENKDIDLLKELALVSHFFLETCSKHLFATIELHDAVPKRHVASSKKGFVKLLKSRPDVVKYIRKLTYKMGGLDALRVGPSFKSDDHLLSAILRTISRLNCLAIIASEFMDWNALDPSLISAFLHLMRLPTINHIDLLYVRNFPLSNLNLSVNLRRLEIFYLRHNNPLQEDGSLEIAAQSEMPQIHEFHTSESSLLTSKLLHAKRQDGRPAFNFMDLRRLSMSSKRFEDERNIRYLLQNAKLLEKLHLSVERGRSLVGLHDILSPSARTLKVLDLTVSIYNNSAHLPLAWLCEELEAMAGHYVLEALSIEVRVDSDETEGLIGSIMHKVEEVLVKPGWSLLRQVSFKISVACYVSSGDSAKLLKVLQSLPDKHLNLLPKLESVAFHYSAYIVKYYSAKHEFLA